MICAKHQCNYGEESKNNVGVFQGSAISALMFIIYLDDMMEDYEAMNHKAKLTARQQIIRGPNTGTAELIQQIREEQQKKRHR